MASKDDQDSGQLSTTAMMLAYEELMREFAVNAAQFLEHLALLRQARDSYQRAMDVSSRLRDTLDHGDQVLRTLMAKIDQALDNSGTDTADKKRLGQARKSESANPNGERADAAVA